jgi:pyruvate kinase
MQKSPRPTRAEVSDVTNAVYDGADCVMLSGESAKGKYPAATVQFMQEIIGAAEQYAVLSSRELSLLGHPNPRTRVPFRAPDSIEASLAQAAVAMSTQRGNRCKAILVLSHYGSLPPLVAAFRPDVPIVVLCPTPKLARQLQIYRGIHPIVCALPVHDNGSTHTTMAQAMTEAQNMGYIGTGDEVIFVSHDHRPTHKAVATLKIAKVA